MKLSVDASPGKEFTDEHGTFNFIELVGDKNMAVAYVRDDSIYEGKGLEIAKKLADRFNAGEDAESVKIRISRDHKGISFWRGKVKLDYHEDKDGKGEFFDDDCEDRGTESSFDLVDMLLGDEWDVNLAYGQYIDVECNVSAIKTHKGDGGE